MATNPSTYAPRCIRCKAELPGGTTFCVACGCQNDDDIHAKRLGSVIQANNRINRAKNWREALGWFGFWIWW